ncbi:MAG: RcnB family protein [Xanthomonadales bacterium]|nr:RcnB family protein [Xanthomonadales bacterium]
MKTTLKLASMALAVLGAVSLPAMAKDHGDGRPYYVAYGDDGHGRGRGHDRDDDDQGRGHYRGDDRRYYGDRDDRDRRYHKNGHWDNGRRGPPSWARGHDYRSYGYRNVYVVPYADYRPHRLYAPRPGYRWVRDDGGHYMLVAIASGIIADVLIRGAGL